MKKRIGYYLSLIAILVLGFALFLQTSYDRTLQMQIMYATGGFYILWGIIYHLANHDLNFKIVIEYVLMGSLGIAIMRFFLKGAL